MDPSSSSAGAAEATTLSLQGQSYIPDYILGATSLRNLSITQGAVSEIPAQFSTLVSLESLDLSRNLLMSIRGLGGLGNLKTLRLDDNAIATLDLETIRSLTSLTHLSLTGTQIGSVWTLVEALHTLTHLKTLDMMSLAYENLFRMGNNALNNQQQQPAEQQQQRQARNEEEQPEDGNADEAEGEQSSVASNESGAMVLEEYDYSAQLDRTNSNDSEVEGEQQQHQQDEDDGNHRVASSEDSRSNWDQIESADESPFEYLEDFSDDDSDDDDDEEYDSFRDDDDENFSNDFVDSLSDDSDDDADGNQEEIAPLLPNLIEAQQGQVPNQPQAPETATQSIRRLLALSEYLRALVKNRSAPVCRREHYRALMIVLLPQLSCLDRRTITDAEREDSAQTLERIFMISPAPQRCMFSNVMQREAGFWRASSGNPKLLQRDVTHRVLGTCLAARKRIMFPQLRPRQMEFHPTIGGRVVFGTTNGQLVVCNPYSGEHGSIHAISPAAGSNIVLGISWLKHDPDKFLAGCVNGNIGLYSVDGMKRLGMDYKPQLGYTTFPDLTSVSSNCNDTQFITSGYSKNLNISDVYTGKLLHRLVDVHDDKMNVVKFANQSPFLFATSSTDSSIKIFDTRVPDFWDHPLLHGRTDHSCLMVVFSPDDRYVLSSSEDNEIRQWDVAQRDLHFVIDHLPKRRNGENHCRAYYMNHGDYIISGSVDQSQIFVTSSIDGRLVREIELGGIAGHPAAAKSVYCQSLRGDPIFPNRMAAISSYDIRDERGYSVFRFVSVELGMDDILGA